MVVVERDAGDGTVGVHPSLLGGDPGHDRARLVAKRRAHVDAHAVAARVPDAARMQDPRTERSELEHGVVVDAQQHGRGRHLVRVGREDPVGVREDLALLGAERGRERHRRRIRAAAPEGVDLAVRVHALEPSDHAHVDLAKGGEQARRVDPHDARRSEGAVGEEPGLGAREGARAHAQVLEREGDERHRDLFAGRHEVVELAAVGSGHDLARGGDEAVGRMAHGADGHADLGALRDRALDALGHLADAIDIAHTGAAELLDAQGEGRRAALGRCLHGRAAYQEPPTDARRRDGAPLDRAAAAPSRAPRCGRDADGDGSNAPETAW